MAVPKKKISVSRKKTRLYTKRYTLKYFTKCVNCSDFVSLHRRCSCDTKNTTNLVNKYNLDFL